MIQLRPEHYWLYAAVDPETNEFTHTRLFTSRNEGVISISLSGLTEKYDIKNTVFLVNFAP